MAMLGDLLQRLMSGDVSLPASDNNVVTPDAMIRGKQIGSDPGNITTDSGQIVDYSLGNPFAKLSEAITKSRDNNNQGPSLLKQLLGSILNNGSMAPGTGTVGGGGPPDHTPGTQQDAALNPTPMKMQKQKNLAPAIPQPQLPPPPDYSMPQALDPVSIEELRQSLLGQAGQLDPNNPNGLAGRMSSPNANVDQRNQMNDAQRQSDSLRGFDGSRSQKIKDANNGGR